MIQAIDLILQLAEKNIRIYVEEGKLKLNDPNKNINEDMLATIKLHKQALIKYLSDVDEKTAEAIPQIPVAQQYSVSSAQRRLWILSKFQGGSTAYNIPGVYVFEGNLNYIALEQSFNTIIERHEILRTIFKEDEENNAWQIIQPIQDASFKIAYQDLRQQTNQQKNIQAFIHADCNDAFDISTGPLLRASLYQLENNKWIFVYVMHHIIGDGWSMNILIQELLTLYHAYTNKQPNTLTPLRIQYKDYAAWQQQQLSNAETQIHKNYWLHQFTETLPILALPTDKPRPSVKTYNGGVVHKTLPAPLIKNIKALSHEQGGTLFMGLLSGVYALLYKYTHQQDIIIGSPIAGRAHADLENQIGFYVNTLALRTQFKATENYKQLLTHVKQVTLNAHEHQLYPFDELVEQLNLQRDMSRNPLFDVMVSMDAASTNAQQQIGDLHITTYKEETNITSKFDLLFNFAETENEVQLSIEYNNDLFNADTILRMANHVEQLLTNAVAKPTIPLQQLNYLDEKEKHQLTTVFNNTSTQQIHSKTVIALFEEQVQKTPHDVALIFETKKITYKALNEHANRLAHYIQTNYTIKPDDVIGIQLERSEWMIISILAVLKSGGAYVPIDTTYPQERVHYIIENSACKVVINEKEVEKFKKEANKYEPHHVSTIHQYDDLAYIIYTSGSTGTPKGCAITHKSFSNYIQWANNYYATQATKVNFGLYTSLAFDLTITSIFCTLTQGGQLFIYPQQQELSAILQHTFSADSGINYIKLTPSHITVLHQLNITSSNIIVAIVGGEEVTPQHVHILKKINPAIRIYNEYGPTEATVGCVVKQLEENESIQIGKPIAQTAIYILDEDDQLCAIGVIGEICISGDGLARGYLHKPELTKEKFVPNPFKPATKMYKTGDIGRWLADGNIEYIGRKDDQVKIRGYRIELGEIETALQKYPHIDTAVVAVKWNTQNEKELVAYIISKQAFNIADIRTHLSKTLPLYMLPNYFVQLDSLPLTHNGKIDKQALPNPEALGISSGVEYIAPTNAIEEKLVQIWQEILSKEKIGIKDNFFALGGHSLKAIRLAGQIYKQFEVKIALQQLFVQQTVQEQAQYIQQTQTTTYTNIPVATEQADYTLSSSQRRLWILSQFEEGNVAYNIPGVYVFEGNLNKEALHYAFHALLTRHEILRTGFKQNEAGEARQFIRPAQAIQFNIPYQDLSNTNQKQSLQQFIEASFTEPFNLTTDILLRAKLFKISDNKWIFTYIMHHIISDGWSMDVLIQELLALYHAYTNKQPNTLTPLRIQYKDYAVWQQQQLNDTALQSHKQYWLQQLEGEIPVLALPADKPRPAIKTYNGGSVHKIIDHTLSHDIKVFAHQQGATLFMSLLAAVNALFYRYTNQEDIIIGSPIAGREHPDLENQIGFYVNSLALRTRFSGKDNYINLLQKVKQVTTDAYQHQAYPFDELVAALQLPRDMSRNYLYDVEVILQTNAIGHAKKQEQVNGLTISGYPNTESLTSRFDMVFNFVEVENELQLNIEYNSDIYAAHTIHQLSNHVEQLLRAVLQNPNEPIHQIDFLNEKDKHQLLVTFNNTTAHYPTHTTIIHLFEECVQKTPDAIALFYEGETLTYKELNEKANQLANYLQSEYHIQSNDLVGIMLNRSEKAIVAILGILKAGAAYVPIDPTYPAARKEFIIQDTNIKALITQIDYLFDVSYYTGNIFAIDVQLDTIEASTQSPTTTVQPEYLAYIIYTSGSTGEPKGVMIEHKAIINTIQYQHHIFNLKQGERGLQFASLSFDASVWEMFSILTSGGILYIIDEDKKKNPTAIEKYITENKIDIATLPPAYLKLLQIENIPTVKNLITAGEAAVAKDAMAFAQQGIYYNAYGPTETSICATIYKVDKERKIETDSIPIGTPIANTAIYILDNDENVLPIGVIGEICISGDGLARGYLNKAELTKEKFVDNPFKPGSKMYKTGDIGRWLPDGNIEYIGRKDEQVKIRGYRIELGEIETALQKHENITAAVVIAKENQQQEKELVAYIVGKQALNTTEIRNYLSNSLPLYMLPSHYVQLDALPLNANGKLDKKALPNPETLGLSSGVAYVEPTNEVEKHLVAVYEEVLKKHPIGISEDFFALGGDSIKSIQVVSRLKQRGYSVTIRDMMTHPVIQNLATKVQIDTRHIDQNIVEGLIPLSPIQHYFFENYTIDTHHYNQSVLLQSKTTISEHALKAALDKLVLHHDALRMIYKKTDKGWIQENKGGELVAVAPAVASVLTSHHQQDDADQWTMGTPSTAFEIINLAVAAVASVPTSHHQQDESTFIEHCNRIQSSINLETGPLFKAVLFKHAQQQDQLLLVCHHLVIDGVSWRILLEDLSTLYQQHLAGSTLTLPLKTDSFQYWQQKQLEYATSKTLQKEENYWSSVASTNISSLPKDNAQGSNRVGDTAVADFMLDENLTQQLLTQCYQAYQTDINDILLSALSLAIQATFNLQHIAINLEGHGREDIGAQVDVSRTIGWFTSLYPVVINTQHSNNLIRHVIEVKETLHRIPNKGIGYGILKYLSQKSYSITPEIIFNYLGDFGTGVPNKQGEKLFEFSTAEDGQKMSDNMQRDHVLEISGMVVDEKLRLSISYSKQQYKSATITQLKNNYEQQLQRIIQQLAAAQKTYLTPVDLTYKALTVEQVQQLNANDNLEDVYPLSPLQEGLYYYWLTTPGSSAYFDQMSYQVQGHLNVALLEQSYQKLVNRHAVLRTYFTQALDDKILQVVQKQVPANFIHLHVAEDKHFSIEKYKQEDRTKSFDLHIGSQMRLTLLELGNNTYEFIWSFHHILMDGWCVGILIKEFFEIYNNEEQNTIPQLPKVHPYSKYIQWLNTIDQQKSHDYWKNYLLGYDTLSSLAILSTKQQQKHISNKQISSPHSVNDVPHDINSLPHGINDVPHNINSLPHGINDVPHGINDVPHDINSLPHGINDVPHDINSLPHGVNDVPHNINSLPHSINDVPQNQIYDPQQEIVVITKDTHQAIQTLCAQLGVTQNTFIQTVWGILLSKYNNTNDVVFGSVVSGRPAEIEGIEEMIGLFINTIPVRIQIEAEKTITELLKQVQQQSTESTQHHYTQLAEIQSESELGRNLFDHIMVFENYPVQEMVEQSVGNKKDAKLSILSAEEFDQTGYDLTVLVMPEDNLSIKFKYNGNIYDKALINRLQNHLTQIIEQVLANPAHATHQINYISASEQHELLVTFNDTAANYSTNKTLTQLFEEQAAQTPNNIAVIFQEKTYSYSTLNQHANRLAHYLQSKYNIQPNDLIGIQLEKSEWMIISILGALKSGGAYLPIDPSYPQERINYIIEDSKCKLVINQKEIEKFKKEANNYTDNNLPNINTPTDLAYVIYTSGSTGQPKGCMLEHRGVINRIEWMYQQYNFSTADIILQKTNFTFDVSVWEIFMPLCWGVKMVLCQKEDIGSPERILKLIHQHKITCLHFVPSMLNAFMANIFNDDKNIQALSSVTKLITSGEALSVETVKNWYAKTNIPIHNLYGPTEASIDVTHYTTSQEDTIIPIGRPIWNTQLYIIDKHHHLLPMGAVGEICISGDGLARGYLNKAALTKEKFVDNPFKPGSKMYKTGDIGRWLPDGNIEYIGRKDEQVKIRGYRIELGEIETALQKHANITAAAVVAKDNQQQEKELVAYIVSKQALNTTEIRNYLSNSLPLYMLPSHYVQLDALPLNANGKLDKKALPNPETLGLSSGVAYVKPTNEVEKHLVAVYEEVLKKHPIGISEDFFALGGDSIKSIQVVSRLKQRGYSVTIRDMMTYPVIQHLATKVQIDTRHIDQNIVEGLIPFSPIQYYFFEQHSVDNHHYNQSILLQSNITVSEHALKAALDKLVLHHDALRMIYRKTAVGCIQENKGEEQGYGFEIINLAVAPAVASVLTSHHQQDESTFIEHCNRIQSSINLETGPLFKAALFKHAQQQDQLLLVCHHLVIDGVSWRILLEDLSTLYQQHLAGSTLTLPLKTDSFQYWQQKQLEYALSKTIQQQEAYWSSVASTKINRLPKDNAEGSNRVGDTAVADFMLDENLTQQLLTQCYQAYQTDINDILLSALSLAIQATFNLQHIAINLEGHGREDIGTSIDVSRTIGWFTSLYPVIIDTSYSEDIIRHVIEVKETLHRIPNKGIGYGILKYLAHKSYSIMPEIIFNYLGDFGTGVHNQQGEQLFTFSEKEHGQNMSENMHRDYVLDISGMIVDKKMRLSVRYSSQQYTNITINRLLEDYQQQLQNIIQQLSTEQKTHVTPVDLTYKQLTVEELQELNNIL